ERLDDAILAVVAQAGPPVGRTRAVEILRGGRSRVVLDNGYDDLPLYGAFAHLRGDDVLGHVDALLAGGRLRSTSGAFPKLAVVGGAPPPPDVSRARSVREPGVAERLPELAAAIIEVVPTASPAGGRAGTE